MKDTIETIKWAKKFKGKTFVIKLGGAIFQDKETLDTIAEDIVSLQALGIKPVIIHGGGKEATKYSKALGIDPQIINGRRVTKAEEIPILSAVYRGKINLELVSAVTKHGSKAIGLSGLDGHIVIGKKRKPMDLKINGKIEKVDMGEVGDVESVDTELIGSVLKNEMIPVICSLVGDKSGNVYNVNADILAKDIAVALGAAKLLILSDSPITNDGKKIPVLSVSEAHKFIEDGTINGGMEVKILNCLAAVEAGIKQVHVLDGNLSHAILIETLTDKGIGSMVVSDQDAEAYFGGVENGN